jgi:hypothetical protein
VSSRARATFHCSTLDAFSSDRLFDVVLAVEVLYSVQAVDVTIELLVALGRRSVIVSYTHRERHRLEPYLDPYCPTEQRAFCPFFRLASFGFTVAHLVRPLQAKR